MTLLSRWVILLYACVLLAWDHVQYNLVVVLRFWSTYKCDLALKSLLVCLRPQLEVADELALETYVLLRRRPPGIFRVLFMEVKVALPHRIHGV